MEAAEEGNIDAMAEATDGLSHDKLRAFFQWLIETYAYLASDYLPAFMKAHAGSAEAKIALEEMIEAYDIDTEDQYAYTPYLSKSDLNELYLEAISENVEYELSDGSSTIWGYLHELPGRIGLLSSYIEHIKLTPSPEEDTVLFEGEMTIELEHWWDNEEDTSSYLSFPVTFEGRVDASGLDIEQASVDTEDFYK